MKTLILYIHTIKNQLSQISKSAVIVVSSLLFLLTFIGCTKEFLDRKPLGQLTSDTFFSTSAQAVESVNAIYQQLRVWETHAFGFLGCTDIMSDDADKGSTPNDGIYQSDLDNFIHTPDNPSVVAVWTGYFQGISRCNIAIDKIPAIAMDANLKSRLIAEAKFLRAYYYFNLVRWFGELPLITKPLSTTEFVQKRVPAKDIYQQIVKDLTEAAAVLPEKSKYAASDMGRITKGAANGYLAKVYLTMGDFSNAELLATTVINSKEYSLFPSYYDQFLIENENCSESIFEIQATLINAETLGSAQWNQIQGVRGTPNLGWGFNRPSDNLIAAFEPGDPRREATILYVGEVLPDGSAIVEDNPETFGERYNQKAWTPQHIGFQENSPGNIRIFRYADLLLIAAEAMNENGKSAEAISIVNQIRKRARGSLPANLVLKELVSQGKDADRQAIWKERRVELALEQHRWFDLIRQKRAAEVMQLVGKTNFVKGKHELLPIPQTEIDISNNTLTQNFGY
ncbi:MAG: RagB/SusD family nutrient uptake outer membrane protein [Saprospiraceae bacterium]